MDGHLGEGDRREDGREERRIQNVVDEKKINGLE
jgi:hypothetical protein